MRNVLQRLSMIQCMHMHHSSACTNIVVDGCACLSSYVGCIRVGCVGCVCVGCVCGMFVGCLWDVCGMFVGCTYVSVNGALAINK
jgi:hypothetical protein